MSPPGPGAAGATPSGNAPSLSAPAVLHPLAERLAASGGQPLWTGGDLTRQLRGLPARYLEIVDRLSPQALLRCLPRAVALVEGVAAPTTQGFVRVRTVRGGSHDAELRQRDFTVRAVGLDLVSGAVLDPTGGLDDLAENRLAAVGEPGDVLDRDPLCALRAARLCGELGLEPEPRLREALRQRSRAALGIPAARRRHELLRLLLSPHAAAGLRLLRDTGLAAAVGGGGDPELVASLPPRAEIRLLTWLGASPGAGLRQLRIPAPLSRRVELLAGHHPLDRTTPAGRPQAVRRLLKRTSADDRVLLFALRRAELAAGRVEDAPAVEEALAALASTLETWQARERTGRIRAGLALDGRAIGAYLGLPPGPGIGRALQYLAEQVERDPSRNQPEQLRRLLDAWRESEGRDGRRPQ